MKNKIVHLLEKIGWRCSACARWFQSDVSIERETQWGTDVGGLLLMDPFIRKERIRTCECGHAMSSRFDGTESV